MKIIIPENIASTGKIIFTGIPISGETEAAKRTEVKAPAGPTTLNLLPPNIAAIIVAQKPVIIPACGVPPEAIAIAIDNGIETQATVIPDFKFSLINFFIWSLFIFIFFYYCSPNNYFSKYNYYLKLTQNLNIITPKLIFTNSQKKSATAPNCGTVADLGLSTEPVKICQQRRAILALLPWQVLPAFRESDSR